MVAEIVRGEKVVQKRILLSLILLFLAFLFCFPAFAWAEGWQEVAGPVVALVATIEPFVNLEISSEYYDDGAPVVHFLCDQGPGMYDGNPLTVKLTTNVPVKLYCDVTDLAGKNGFSIPENRLWVHFDDPEKKNEPFHNFKNKEDKGVKIYHSSKPVSLETKCYFRVEITPEDQAGEYRGQAFFTVLYKL